ncbi:MAG: tetratricopeptide repeat protein [Bacteroidales bacterium]|nr:tetratricopeptide repeat protein [Bacteroidales bacterium]
MAKKKTRKADNIQELETVLTKTEQFIEENQKPISYVIGAIILIVMGYLAFNKFYLQPREKEAQSQMFMAENYFEKDSFNLAINGDGNYLGFLDIIDDYTMTKSANLAKYYTGISFLHLGQYEEAFDYLNDFKTKDLLLATVAEGAKGDAKLEQGKEKEALNYYKKAYSLNNNEFTNPVFMMKAARLLESMEDLSGALVIYKEIKEKYPQSPEGQNIDKYIATVENLLN